jgi:hypothetical protein
MAFSVLIRRWAARQLSVYPSLLPSENAVAAEAAPINSIEYQKQLANSVHPTSSAD